MLQPLGPLQTKFVAALRSGQYPQTKRHLHDDRGYCCLGVACEVVGITSVWDENEQAFTYHGESENLPSFAGSKLKLRGPGGAAKTLSHALWLLNDHDNKTFREIADIIEEDPSEYFTEPA